MRVAAADQSIEDVVAATGGADLVVGIPSYNNGKTIGHVAATAVHGLSTFFAGRPALVLNSDGGSADGTSTAMVAAGSAACESLDETHRRWIRIESMRYRGPSGKGSAFRDIFEVAERVNAVAVVVLDADLRSVSPEWIDRLASPIVSGRFDFVTPLYKRHKFDGTITNNIIYPMTNALFGGDIRQPIGGDFGVGTPLVRAYVADTVWETDVARFGVDIWMTTTALVNGFRVAQAHLGAKVHDPKDPGQHLAKMLVEVVGTWFDLVERYSQAWANGDGSAPAAPRLGSEPASDVTHVNVNVDSLLDQFRFGVETLTPIYASVLPAALVERFGAISAGAGAMPFDDSTWARTVYAFALAYRRRALPVQQLLSSLTPLYLGRVASFVIANGNSSEEAAEKQVQQLARVFRSLCPDFATEWRAERSPQ
ncbi:MAG TPA: glycosyl transferase family 2 [Thermoanaerobaculia bacterium]|nr:glycosyl transferase family 2 [Thermoanaerobaculia bacterium]